MQAAGQVFGSIVQEAIAEKYVLELFEQALEAL
jgi:hypothetical protein